MKIVKNIQIQGKHQKPILVDLNYKENNLPKDIVIFCHGYKGYKDWGSWNLVARSFAEQNIFFIKMNFSHNGGTPDEPIDFPDLEAFGNNNLTMELDDLECVIDWIVENDSIKNEIDCKRINLIGHSRGGGIVVLKAGEDQRINKVISWAGVSDYSARFPIGKELEVWRDNGVAYVENARTKQQMPHYFQFYKNFKENQARLNIQNAVQKLNIPYLIIHGSTDETVSLKEAKNLSLWNSNNTLEIIENADHSFGSKQPWETKFLPKVLEEVVLKTIQFLKL